MRLSRTARSAQQRQHGGRVEDNSDIGPTFPGYVVPPTLVQRKRQSQWRQRSGAITSVMRRHGKVRQRRPARANESAYTEITDSFAMRLIQALFDQRRRIKCVDMATYHYYRRAVGTFGSGPSSIRFNGRDYLYRGYAYENFIDAYNYAQLMLLHPSSAPLSTQAIFTKRVPPPSADDLRLMQQFGIEFVAGHYFYGAYRYDCLGDACAFASVAPGQPIYQRNLQIARAAHHLNLLQERYMVDGKGKTLKLRSTGRIGHYDIFPANAPTSLLFKRSLLRK